MLTVNGDLDDVERWLGEGALTCPDCGAVLTRWGWARPRRVRDAGTAQVELRPRRAQCSGCAATHVLLAVSCLARRADTVAVIGAAVRAAAGGMGARRVAEQVGRPVTTVRGWLSRLAGRAIALRAALAVRLRAVAADPRVPEVDGSGLAGLVAVAGALRDAAAARWALPTLSVWELVSFLTAGGLLLPAFTPASINTSPRLAG